MKTTNKILAVLLAALMTLSLGVTALANSPVDEDGWMYAPNSPEGLEDGDIWFDFTYLFSDEMTQEQKDAALARYNAGDWYVNMSEHLVKCENGDEALNGVYTRSQEPYILCIREVGVSWVNIHKDFAGIQVGDYYLDKEVFLSVSTEGFTDYFLPQAISAYEEEHEDPLTEEQISEMREGIRQQVEDNVVETYWDGYSFSYNPHGTFYRYKLNMIYVPWGYYIVDYYIARQMMIVVDALDAALRIADEDTVAASQWVRVAGSVDDAEEGGYYLDFDDTESLRTLFNVSDDYSDEQLAEEVSMLKSGEWYADIDRGVVAGKIVVPAEQAGSDEDMVELIPENEEMFTLLKVKPFSETADEWIVLPYDTDGLNDGDWYLDTDTFMAIIGRDKTVEERAAVLELIKRHVVFYYNPEGVHCVFRYDYTDLPDENGEPIGGSAILPMDIELNPDVATLYDYTALLRSVKQYVAPEQPDAPDTSDTPSGNTGNSSGFMGRLYAFIQTILSFFRRLFRIIPN